MAAKPKVDTIDNYLASVSDDQRAALESLRKTILAAVPKAEECINYGVPAFRWNGQVLVGFGAAARHCTFYPMSGATVANHKHDLKNFSTSKGAIRFQPDQPLPAALVRKLIKARMAEIEGTSKHDGPSKNDVQAVIGALKRLATKRTLEGMARYGIPSDKALGVTVGDLQKLAKWLGRNHSLAVALWKTGCYEARMLACYVDEPLLVTSAQMDRWCRDFDNWAICDTACFALFDRTPHAWHKVIKWASRREEFVKRAAFALLWGLSVHDKDAGDPPFVRGLALVEGAASDQRHFVKKAVSMALRAVGKRNTTLRAAAMAVATRLSQSNDPASRWIGKDAAKQLGRPRHR